MLDFISSVLISTLTFIGGLFPPQSLPDVPAAPPAYVSLGDWTYDGPNGFDSIRLGATSYPGALDSFTNPSATDSVATVSHSGQHSNANDAIEALETKIGTGASTAVANSVLSGTSAGVSSWSTGPTLTNLLLTSSSTLQNFTFNNATGTSATTTNLFSTHATTTNLSGTNVTGFGLSSCTGSTNFLQWTSNTFGCGTVSASSITPNHASSTSGNLTVGPLNVTDGKNFLVFGKCSLEQNQTVSLQYKQGTETASTTIDTSNRDNNSTYKDNVPLLGFFTGTTTTTILFNTLCGSSGGGRSGLMVIEN